MGSRVQRMLRWVAARLVLWRRFLPYLVVLLMLSICEVVLRRHGSILDSPMQVFTILLDL